MEKQTYKYSNLYHNNMIPTTDDEKPFDPLEEMRRLTEKRCEENFKLYYIYNLIEFLNTDKEELLEGMDLSNKIKMREIKKRYNIGLKFMRNWKKGYKGYIFSNNIHKAREELERIKVGFSESTYYRYKKKFEDKFLKKKDRKTRDSR